MSTSMAGSLSNWLQALHLEQYLPLLVANGYDSTEKCSVLTDSELDRIGISLVGHKKRILSHLSNINKQTIKNSGQSGNNATPVINNNVTTASSFIIPRRGCRFCNDCDETGGHCVAECSAAEQSTVLAKCTQSNDSEVPPPLPVKKGSNSTIDNAISASNTLLLADSGDKSERFESSPEAPVVQAPSSSDFESRQTTISPSNHTMSSSMISKLPSTMAVPIVAQTKPKPPDKKLAKPAIAPKRTSILIAASQDHRLHIVEKCEEVPEIYVKEKDDTSHIDDNLERVRASLEVEKTRPVPTARTTIPPKSTEVPVATPLCSATSLQASRVVLSAPGENQIKMSVTKQLQSSETFISQQKEESDVVPNVLGVKTVVQNVVVDGLSSKKISQPSSVIAGVNFDLDRLLDSKSFFTKHEDSVQNVASSSCSEQTVGEPNGLHVTLPVAMYENVAIKTSSNDVSSPVNNRPNYDAHLDNVWSPRVENNRNEQLLQALEQFSVASEGQQPLDSCESSDHACSLIDEADADDNMYEEPSEVNEKQYQMMRSVFESYGLNTPMNETSVNKTIQLCSGQVDEPSILPNFQNAGGMSGVQEDVISAQGLDNGNVSLKKQQPVIHADMYKSSALASSTVYENVVTTSANGVALDEKMTQSISNAPCVLEPSFDPFSVINSSAKFDTKLLQTFCDKDVTAIHSRFLKAPGDDENRVEVRNRESRVEYKHVWEMGNSIDGSSGMQRDHIESCISDDDRDQRDNMRPESVFITYPPPSFPPPPLVVNVPDDYVPALPARRKDGDGLVCQLHEPTSPLPPPVPFRRNTSVKDAGHLVMNQSSVDQDQKLINFDSDEITPAKYNMLFPVPDPPKSPVTPPSRTPPAPPPKVGVIYRHPPDQHKPIPGADVGINNNRASYEWEVDEDEDDVDCVEKGSKFRFNKSFSGSEDTLSDGGDFYELGFRRPSGDVLRASIPIVPFVPTKQTDRKGFLYKLNNKSSQMNRLGQQWQKRYVTLDRNFLKYYTNSKNPVSKRIIPVSTMWNVECQLKDDVHCFQFRLSTVDRIYTFASEELDDMSLWASIIMQAIIEAKTSLDNFPEGGDMNSPDLEGFVRMEGCKTKRYLAIKKDKFCFYNTIKDFRAYSPIHVVDLRLASVKDVQKCRLQMHTPNAAFIFLFESQDELCTWKEVFEESISQGLGTDEIMQEVYTNPNNRTCADCDAPNPEWASINLAITLCKHCAGIHRSLTMSKVHSLRMDSKVWKPSILKLLHVVGNENANNFWEWNVGEADKIESTASQSERKEFIYRKYKDRQFCRFHPLKPEQNAIDEALCKSVQFGDVLETMQLVFSGAQIGYVSQQYGAESAIVLAKKAKQLLQEEFLRQNRGREYTETSATAASPNATIVATPSSVSSRNLSDISYNGYLQKTGSNLRGDFNRRWCTLENGCFSYFDNDKSVIAKGCIERNEMLSVSISCDDRLEFAFELGTKRLGGRTYLFAADSSQERIVWINKLARNMANIGIISDLEPVKIPIDIERGGNVYYKLGTPSADWTSSWLHLSQKTLSIYCEKDAGFIDIDLRKCNSAALRPIAEKCPLVSSSDGQAIAVDLRSGRVLYIQCDTRKDTESWLSALLKALIAGESLSSQALTNENVPIIVDKCINFVATYGMDQVGIYRLSGQSSKASQLLEALMNDSRSFIIKSDDYQIHDVTTALKRFLRFLNDPLLTRKLYPKWIEACVMSDEAAKLEWYTYLLKQLPLINYCTLKRIITHLVRVSEQEPANKMGIINLASIFGMVFMKLDKDTEVATSYGNTNSEIVVVKDLLENHRLLFEVKDEELEQERKIEQAMKKIEKLNSQKSVNETKCAEEFLVGVYIGSKECGTVINIQISSSTRAQALQERVLEKAKLELGSCCWSLFEVICNGELERPIHYTEQVMGMILKWGEWPDTFRRDNCIIFKRNRLYEQIQAVSSAHRALFCELKYAASFKKAFHRYTFDFSQYSLSYRKDPKQSSPTASWNVEDLIIYVGAQASRTSPNLRLSFTFISNAEKPVSPYFGHCVCCADEEELYHWLNGMLRAQHPEGLLPNGSQIVLNEFGNTIDDEIDGSSRPINAQPADGGAASGIKSKLAKYSNMFGKKGGKR